MKYHVGHVEGFGQGSPCPNCQSVNCWYEMSAGSKPGYLSVSSHCRDCGYVHKQDSKDDDDNQPVVSPC